MTQLIYVPRSEWGSSTTTESFIRNRVRDPILGKTSIQVHHTGAIDTDDSTPNRWDYDEAAAYMRRLQTSRPDLGPLPYSENYAVNEDLSVVWVFEGRGWNVRGAHTAGHNVTGVGLGAFGNWDKGDVAAAEAILYAMQIRVAVQRAAGYVNLGSQKSPQGWNAWGHRDTTTKTCPGHSLYPLLAGFRLDLDDEDDMPLTRIERAIVDIAFDAGWAAGDRNYWYGLDPDSPEIEQSLLPVIRQGATRLRNIDGGMSRDEVIALVSHMISNTRLSPPN